MASGKTVLKTRVVAFGLFTIAIAGGMQIARGQNGRPLPKPIIIPESAQAAKAAYDAAVKDGTLNAVPITGPPPALPNIDAQTNPDNFVKFGPSSATSGAEAKEKFVPSEVEFVGTSMKHGSPHATIHTTLGDIEIKLNIAQAPITVKNFMDLATGTREFVDSKTSRRVRRPFYDGLTVHKVLANTFIQMGCPLGNGRGGPGFSIQDEIAKELKFDRPGIVAMALAREGVKLTKDSNGSQFFITLSPQPKWNGEFTIFGEVVSGLDVVKKISNVAAGPTDRPIHRVFITSIDTRDDEGRHAPASASPPVPAPASPTATGMPAVIPAPQYAAPPPAPFVPPSRATAPQPMRTAPVPVAPPPAPPAAAAAPAPANAAPIKK